MIRFTQHENSRLYLPDNSSPGGKGFFSFLLTQKLEKLPESLSVIDSWDKNCGVYLFLLSMPSRMADFIGKVADWFEKQYPDVSHSCFAWIDYDEKTDNIQKVTLVKTTTKGNAEKVSLTESMQFDFLNYSLPLRQNAPVSTASDTGGNISGFIFAYPPYDGAPQPRHEYNIRLPLTGDERGTLNGQVSLGNLSDDPSTGWNASLYYVIRDHKSNQNVPFRYPVFSQEKDGLQMLFDYRLDPVDPLNPDRSYLAFTATSFFLKQRDTGAWYIELNDSSRIASFFRTVYGGKIDLIPLTNSDHPAKLVFEKLPPSNGQSPQFYLAPAGDFALSVGEVGTNFRLLSGLSGAEYFLCTSGTAASPGDILRFVPGKPAFAPSFPVIQPKVAHNKGDHWGAAKAREDFMCKRELSDNADLLSGQDSLLDPAYRTSWIEVRPGSAAIQNEPGLTEGAIVPVYFCQPDDAALYDHDSVSLDVRKEFLLLRETPAAEFDAASEKSVPMVPYAGATNTDVLIDFEKQVLSPTRRNAMFNSNAGQQYRGTRPEDNTVVATTPQGLLVTLSHKWEWQSVLLAWDGTNRLEFYDGVTLPLRSALQSNQLFLVATDAASLGTFQNTIKIADWPFIVDVRKNGENGEFHNVLIIKFASGSVTDRVKSVPSWSGAGTFNKKPELVSAWISSYIESARQDVNSNKQLQKFLDIVDSPTWNGILALRVDIGAGNFPEELKGLLAGIDRSSFFAHHVGIEINYIEPENGQLAMSKSSLFGLIHYVDRSYRSRQALRDHLTGTSFIFSAQDADSPVSSETGELYDFRVLTMQVVFENSEIKEYSSRIQLTTTQWFDAPAQLSTRTQGDSLKRQTIEFNGCYENHNGTAIYTFVTDPDAVYQFRLESKVLNYVEIVKAQFDTLKGSEKRTSVATDDTSEQIAARFTFWGVMNFKQLEAFDLFSFGDDPSTANPAVQGLFFSNLEVSMDFSIDEKGKVANRQFGFSPARMSFDTAQSIPRSNSLSSNFPVRFSGLVCSGKESATLSSLGYIPVVLQSDKAMDIQPLKSESWYALLYDLNLGSMGALAAKAGFVAQMAVAWSHDTEDCRVQVGMHLPGAGGGQKTLSLQSVLNVNIQSITLHADVSGGAGSNAVLSYQLQFNNIKLNVLGKKFPGAADTEFVLFGDPEQPKDTTLGWYAAYYNKNNKQGSSGFLSPSVREVR